MTQRSYHNPAPERVTVRDVSDSDDDDGRFAVRMPVTSTAEARDGEAFSRERVEGFAEQIRERTIPVFVDHGRNETTGSRYSALGKMGYLANPEVVDRDAATDAVADFVLLEPAAVSDGAATLRETLETIRSQAANGIPLASSIGWSEETGERDLPGDADLLEASIVGIPSDARTTTATADAGAALARAAGTLHAATEMDAPAVADALRDAITAETVKDATPVAVDGDRAEYEVGDETVTIDPPQSMRDTATMALAKADELEMDCGTGVGDQRARQIADDDVGPDVVDEIAAYLTSHEEDVTAEGPPSEWSDEEWSDCGNLQYAKWGGDGSGEALAWAQERANAVAEARDEELPYPERDGRNLDDPAFGEGDAVMWTWDDAPVHGRVDDVHEEFTPPEADDPITGEDGEAVYSIYEWDDEVEAFDHVSGEPNVGKPESSLDESTADIPTVSEDSLRDMSDTPEPDDESGTDDSTDRMDADSFRESMLEMQEQQTEMLERVVERMGDHDDDDGDDDDMEENAADTDDSDERMVSVETDDGETASIPARDVAAALRDEFDDIDVDALESETTDRTDADDAEDAEDETAADQQFF